MPRKARIDAPGALHHIIIRGIEKRKIFKDDKDCYQFIKRLGTILAETETPIYAWVLMPSHIHLLLKTGLTPIATIMRRLLTGYAVYFNHRYRRHGHLFQNRYKSILCQEEPYFRELVRYIHLNPVRAKLVEDIKALDTYAYCGHGAIVGKVKRDWQEVDYVLGFFGKRRSDARRQYRKFVKNGIQQGRRPELTGGGILRSVGGWKALSALRDEAVRVKGDERILGDTDFVESVLKEADEQLERRYRLQAEGFNLDRVAERVATVMNIPVELVWEKSRRPQVVDARDLLCYWASKELQLSATDLAKRLNLTQPAISIAVRRGEKIAMDNQYQLIN
ncbi:MAG: transposase [Deltaproteobacteria bacterium]|jgi:REP element-mobilizing transposase RayT|nr:transposase [Deltaproteobacteria bacterium]MBW2490490.1 transposase [Deltaproteobacteria bacterium]